VRELSTITPLVPPVAVIPFVELAGAVVVVTE
jgi:hypothetical protein